MKIVYRIFAFIAISSLAVNAQSYTGQSTQNIQSTQKHAILKVKGSCDMCKERIEKAALSVNGVSIAEWDAKIKDLHITYDSTKNNLDVVSKAIAKVGHNTEKDKADSKVYETLPLCCKYKEIVHDLGSDGCVIP